MEWNTELDLALRSVAWTPLRCADRASTADKVLLAKFHVDHGHGSGGSAASCCLLLFDCESGLAYFEPFRSSRLLKRCTFIDDGAELASSSHSQDSSDARTQAIVRRLERMFSPAAREDDRFETVFTVDGSRYATSLDVRQRLKADATEAFAFSFEADTLDHEHVSSIFLNHWAMPLLGVGSAMNSLLTQGAASSSHLLPSMQTAIDESAGRAQQDHCLPFLDFFGTAFLSTSMTRWSETHQRREQPCAILSTYGTHPVQAREASKPMRPEIADESSALSPPASRTHQSPPRLSSTRAASQSPGASSAAGQSNKRPSPAEATADTSPVKKIRNSLSGIGNGRDARRTDPASADVHMQPPHLSSTEPGQATDVANQDEEEEDDDPTASENSTDDEQPDRPSGPVPTLDQRALSLPVPPPAPAPVSVPLPVAKREPSPPQELPPASSSRDTDMELSPPPTELASRLAPTSSSANTSPSKGGPPPSRTIVAPLRKSGAPARGTARSRRF